MHLFSILDSKKVFLPRLGENAYFSWMCAHIKKKQKKESQRKNVMVYAWSPSTQEAEKGGSTSLRPTRAT
jgi:hypothetical protein